MNFKITWILTSIIGGIISGGIVYYLTESLTWSIISFSIVSVLLLIHNPSTRYMKAFYVLLFPLLNDVYFKIKVFGSSYNLEAGMDKSDVISTITLFLLSATCLILDFITRSDKKFKFTWTRNKNIIKGASGDNITISQKIEDKNIPK